MKILKGFTLIEAILTLVIIGIISSVVWYVRTSNDKTLDTLSNADMANSSITNYSESGGFNRYENKKLGISFLYPKDWKETGTNLQTDRFKEDNTFTSPDFKLKDNDAFGQISSGGYFWIQVIVTDYKNIDDYKKISSGPGDYRVDMKDITIDGYSALRDEKCGHPIVSNICLIFFKNGYRYSISYKYAIGENATNAKYLKEFNKLIDSIELESQ